jgi:hypothetical protein
MEKRTCIPVQWVSVLKAVKLLVDTSWDGPQEGSREDEVGRTRNTMGDFKSMVTP